MAEGGGGCIHESFIVAGSVCVTGVMAIRWTQGCSSVTFNSAEELKPGPYLFFIAFFFFVHSVSYSRHFGQIQPSYLPAQPHA